MNPNSPLTIFAMVGPMGSGKTTLALAIAKEQGALYQSLDGTIKSFNEHIGDLQGYERLMSKALDLMFLRALAALKNDQSVVFDEWRWPWLMELAEAADTKVELYHFEVSAKERWRRVQKRNEEKPTNVYQFTMSKEEFDAENPYRQLPALVPGLKIVKITD